MSEAVLARCEAWTAKHGDFMDESGLQVLLQGISSSEVSLLYKAFAGSEAEKLPLLPFVQWLFKALVDTPPAARAPEESGVPLQEFTRLLTEHKAWLSTATWNPHTGCACRPNMYDVVETIIKPLTQARLVSYAELLEPLAPQVFVSHWWGEEFVCFVRALQLFAGTCMSQASSDFTDASNTPEANSDPGANLAFWVCSFANRQWEVNLGSTLQESPFERALAAPSCTHVLMIMDPDATPLQRIWCLYEVLRAHALKKKFHIATDNGVLTFGSDEPFGQQRQDLLTLTKRVLEIDPATAKASQEQDRRMIMAEVDKAVGLEQFGLQVMSLLAWAFRRRGGEQLAMDAPELKPRFFRLVRLGEMLVTFEGRTMLHCVAQRKEPPEVRLALTAAAAEDLACCNSLGQTPLHVAAAYNRHVDVIDLLITARMDVNARDRNGLTPWMLSAATGHHEALVRLLAWGADLSCDLDLWQFDKVPWEAKIIPNGLFMAAFSGSSECCQIFLSRAAKVHEVMLIAACIGGNVAALQTMLPHAQHVISRGGPFSPLFSASFCGQLDCVDLLLRHQALPNQTCDGGKTAFFAAMACGYEDVGRLLLSYRADPWVRTEADDTALLVASGGGHDGCVRMMLSLRANLHQTCGEAEGKVLHVAAEWGREQTVRLLVESRADPKAVDKKQRTPLHKAADHGYVEVLAALLELNADPRAVDSAGQASYVRRLRGTAALDGDHHVFASSGLVRANIRERSAVLGPGLSTSHGLPLLVAREAGTLGRPCLLYTAYQPWLRRHELQGVLAHLGDRVRPFHLSTRCLRCQLGVWCQGPGATFFNSVAAVAAAAPGAVLIDHAHFQYNGVCLGLCLAAAGCVARGRTALASVLFTSGLLFKQIALYYAPAFFFGILGICLWRPPVGIFMASQRVVATGLVVLSSASLLLAPWLLSGHPFAAVLQVLHRMFPFARGLYEDKVANFWCSISVVLKVHRLLPAAHIPRLCAAATLLALLPSALCSLRPRAGPGSFAAALFTSSLSFFLFAFQVHEKGILFAATAAALLPMAMPARHVALAVLAARHFQLVALFSMYPLMVKDLLVVPYALACLSLVAFCEMAAYQVPCARSRLLLRASYLVGLLLHGIHAFAPAPARYPDLWTLLITSASCSYFVCALVVVSVAQMRGLFSAEADTAKQKEQ